jgi:hypothetical protein
VATPNQALQQTGHAKAASPAPRPLPREPAAELVVRRKEVPEMAMLQVGSRFLNTDNITDIDFYMDAVPDDSKPAPRTDFFGEGRPIKQVTVAAVTFVNGSTLKFHADQEVSALQEYCRSNKAT